MQQPTRQRCGALCLQCRPRVRRMQVGPFIKLGPLRNVEGVAEIAGSLSAAGLVLILSLALTIYGAASFQQDKSQVGLKTLSGAPHGACLPPTLRSNAMSGCAGCA